jgi:hypothetical protein
MMHFGATVLLHLIILRVKKNVLIDDLPKGYNYNKVKLIGIESIPKRYFQVEDYYGADCKETNNAFAADCKDFLLSVHNEQ